MRLIDADAFISDLGSGGGTAIGNIRKMVAAYPTAYDVNKVVEQFEKRKECLINEFVLADVSRRRKEDAMCRMNEIDGMIEIIKAGGIDVGSLN